MLLKIDNTLILDRNEYRLSRSFGKITEQHLSKNIHLAAKWNS
jgi:hypothetical protein